MDSSPLPGERSARVKEDNQCTEKTHNGGPISTLNNRRTLATTADNNSPSQPQVLRLESDDSSSHNPMRTAVENSLKPARPTEIPGYVKFDNFVKISFNLTNKDEIRALKNKLVSELDQVMSLMKRLDAHRIELDNAVDKHAMRKSSEPVSLQSLKELTVSAKENENVYGLNRDMAEKKKSASKVNQGDCDAVVWDENLGQGGSNKKLKSNEMGSLFLSDKDLNRLFKNCSSLLDKLMKHKYGWVFNNPVDVEGLGLHDYYTIIKHPMDLGTVKERLRKKMYDSPMKFAEDVRLTFSNAMLYNPKGQDVHVMAEQLSKMFEEKWRNIEQDYNLSKRLVTCHNSGLPTPRSQKVAPAWSKRPLEVRNFEAVESMRKPVGPKMRGMDSARKAKASVPMKAKTKKLEKRDMTFEEKQRLSFDLQELPSDKLELVVEIIKKRNPVLTQEDDEIEVDIDSFDPETLWELDAFVNNYNSLNRSKRKAEYYPQVNLEDGYYVQDSAIEPAISEAPKGIRAAERIPATSSHGEGAKQDEDARESSNSSGSRRGSGPPSSAGSDTDGSCT